MAEKRKRYKSFSRWAASTIRPRCILESLGINEWNQLRKRSIPGWWIQNTNCCLPWRCHCFPHYQFSQNWNNLSARMQRWKKKQRALIFLFLLFLRVSSVFRCLVSYCNTALHMPHFQRLMGLQITSIYSRAETIILTIFFINQLIVLSNFLTWFDL